MKKFLFLILICSLTGCIQDDDAFNHSENLSQPSNDFHLRLIEPKDGLTQSNQEENFDQPPKDKGQNGGKP